jgi:hypothetical protein
MTPEVDDAEARVEALLDADDKLAAVIPTGESDAAAYYLAVVERPHPDAEGSVILMERYAQLAAEWSDMSDTFLKNGINRRAEAGDGGLARDLAQAYGRVAAAQDADTVGERDAWTPED